MKSGAPSVGESLDTLFEGRIAILQRKRGYRFSLDAVLLAHFLKVSGEEKIVDLGSGCGVIPLILASFYPSIKVTGLEIQGEMVERALRSACLNRLERRVQMVQGDVRDVEKLFSPSIFEAAICNPPFRRASSGRVNPDSEKRIARHELRGSLGDFLRAGSYLLRQGGRIALIYPAARAVDLLQAMRQEELEPKRARFVYSFDGEAAALFLVEGIKGAGSELRVMHPLVIYARRGRYTEEVRAMLAGRSISSSKRR